MMIGSPHRKAAVILITASPGDRRPVRGGKAGHGDWPGWGCVGLGLAAVVRRIVSR